MTIRGGLPDAHVAGAGLHQHVYAGRDAYVAGRDLIINETGVPAFTVREFVASPPAKLAELTQARRQPSVLLTAHRQTIAFTGRVAELTALRQWQHDPAARSVWAWHAAGGQGKTRLGQQLGAQSAATGWRVAVAGHQSAAPADLDAKPLPNPWRWLPTGRRPLLLLVDYAERWPLHDLLCLLTDCRDRAPKVRVLLLARSIGWWPTMAAELGRFGYASGGDGQPRLLSALAENGLGRRRLFDTACQRFTQIYQPDMPACRWPGQWQPPGDINDDSVYGTTLGVHTAALATVEAHTRQAAPPSSAGDVTRYLLDRERAYWARLHGNAPDTVINAARTALLACLAGPQSRDDGIGLLKLTKLAGDTAGQRLLDAHDRCYPPSITGTVLEPVYPDRLAEDFIALCLPASPANELVTPSGHTDSWAATTLVTTHHKPDGTVAYSPGPLAVGTSERNPPVHISRMLIFLAAAAGRHPHVRGWLRTLLTANPALVVRAGGVALAAVVAHTEPILAETIYRLLPEHSLDLGPAAALLAQHLLDSSDNSPEQRARHSNNLAFRLANTGRPQQALAMALEAVNIRRQLVEADPDAHLADLAGALTNLGNHLAELGRPDQAVAPAGEGVEILRQLAKANPDAHLPDFAASLVNFGSVLSGLGRPDQALTPASDAVITYRLLAEINPDSFLPNLAGSLTNLGLILLRLERPEQALAPAQEATDRWRRLAEVNPDALLPNLAGSLTNLGSVLSALKQPDQARALALEAIGIYRRLAAANPDAYQLGLAGSLWAYGMFCVEAKTHFADAFEAVTEALSLYQSLSEQLPDLLAGRLFPVHQTLADVLDGLGRAGEAAELRRKSIEWSGGGSAATG